VYVFVCVCVRVFVRVCVCACVRVCACVFDAPSVYQCWFLLFPDSLMHILSCAHYLVLSPSLHLNSDMDGDMLMRDDKEEPGPIEKEPPGAAVVPMALQREIEGIVAEQAQVLAQWRQEVEEKQLMIANLQQQHDKLELLLKSEADEAVLHNAAHTAHTTHQALLLQQRPQDLGSRSRMLQEPPSMHPLSHLPPPPTHTTAATSATPAPTPALAGQEHIHTHTHARHTTKKPKAPPLATPLIQRYAHSRQNRSYETVFESRSISPVGKKGRGLRRHAHVSAPTTPDMLLCPPLDAWLKV